MGNVFSNIASKPASPTENIFKKIVTEGLTGKTITDFFKGPEPIKPPTPTEPAALPTVEQDQAGDDAARRARRRSSFRETILTGSLKPQPKGKTVLG